MKKMLVLAALAAISIAGYSQVEVSTSPSQDAVEVQKARIESMDSQYRSQTNLMARQYQAQRNIELRKLEKIQGTNAPTLVSPPPSQTPAN